MSYFFPGVALITGSASGIGQGIAIAFAKDGCKKIALWDRNTEGLNETQGLIKQIASDCEVLCLFVDLQEESQVQDVITRVVDKFGRVDYAVNTAGIEGNDLPSAETDTSHFDMVNRINYRGCWLSSKYEISQMLKQEPLPTHDGRPGNRGSIVNIASQLAFVSRPNAGEFNLTMKRN